MLESLTCLRSRSHLVFVIAFAFTVLNGPIHMEDDFRLATGQQATKNNKINYEVIQVAKETDKQENIAETWLSIPRSENNLKRGNKICNREIKCNQNSVIP